MLKEKKPRWYNILVFSEGKSSVRRLQIPRWVFGMLGGIAGVWVLFTLSLGSAMLYYRSIYLGTADVRKQSEELQEEKARLNEKIASIEETISRTDRLAARLETAVGIDKKVMQKGIGPISEEDDLPSAKSLKLADKFELTAVEKESLAEFDNLELKMDELNEYVASVEMRLTDVYEFHQDKLSYWAAIPSIWPVRGWVTSEFGFRRSPRGIGSRFHEGIDIAASTGTAVYASGDGVVTFSGIKHGLGKTIIIDHGFGIITVYGHNSSLFVKEGDKVRRGSSIAAVGRSGRTTGPHLHYQVVVDGVPVDPMRYIIENF